MNLGFKEQHAKDTCLEGGSSSVSEVSPCGQFPEPLVHDLRARQHKITMVNETAHTKGRLG